MGTILQTGLVVMGLMAIGVAFFGIVWPIFEQAIHLLETGALGR